ncbi:MAG: DUF1800 family protein [Geothrix sp.]|uniref:DUF1800 family protein n=1 Tax=Geothrix sp. TaxID=1962974 RepID=UPI0018553E82|nr:DUF1800 family protein [Geothrix sp.]NWJ41170.1 DUF1800 family protein [Geothrix sp.]WIL20839.1 MAG: DUF1800 domain-containing protein [Geothrix sp.]
MAVLTAISSWTLADVQHFARRAGFGLTPEAAAGLQTLAPAAAIDAWIDGTGAAYDATAFTAALATADVVTEPLVTANASDAGSVDVPAVAAPHAFLVEGTDAWRNSLNTAQALCAWRMQHNPYPFQERMALFWHNLFATGWHKVDNAALMLKQYQLFRAQGLARFDDLLAAVSKDPAMCIWLDSVLNNASGTNIPNENYAREAMELYSLGADNGYNQTDITQLARALSGWSFTFAEADYIANPASPSQKRVANAHFKVYDGSSISPDTRLWWGGTGTTSYTMHGTGSIALFGQTFDITSTANGWAKGENALRAIVSVRGAQCAQFLAKRLLTHFVTTGYSTQDLSDVAAMIQASAFDLRAVMKTLLKSQYFFDVANHFALAEGPVSWLVRAARMLCPALTAGAAQTPKGYPAWRLVTSNATTFDQMGMSLLDPSGPNGWKEHAAWLNSNTMRYRTKVAAALAMNETRGYNGTTYPLFPTFVTTDWFPAAPATAQAVYDRLAALLQPGPMPAGVPAGWLAALWPATFTWDAASQAKARELAFLILCSPAGQLY